MYPPPNRREVRPNEDAKIQLVRQEIHGFGWQRAFLNASVKEKVDIRNSSILDFLRNDGEFINY